MNTELTTETTPLGAAERRPEDVELGTWLGRREAFAIVAGRCSAADIASLRVIRERELYRHEGLTWDDFCSRQLGVNRTTVDRQIRYLEEFGPSFFHLNALTHVTPREFRAIRERVSAEGLHVETEVIALVPENSGRIFRAVAELRATAVPKPAPAPPTFKAALQRCDAAVAALRAVPHCICIQEKIALAEAVFRLRSAAAGLGVATI